MVTRHWQGNERIAANRARWRRNARIRLAAGWVALTGFVVSWPLLAYLLGTS